ncbi:MAG: uracil-DNA glycosylase [Gemmatimonadetes bacterium]|nr:uracil-DNA glycosylase [Gemmatimonadota bacterium]
MLALQERITRCRACPRLVEWRERIAVEKRAAFRDQTYRGRPVPSFGDPDAPLLVVGLAPAAHGANRTGRMFTGDRSGDWLFGALHRAGFANQAGARSRDDGLRLTDVWITAAVRCAPPGNRPTPAERDACRPWLDEELDQMGPGLRAVVCLGGFSWAQTLRVLAARGWQVPRPRPRFTHGAEVRLTEVATGRHLTVLGSYHPSQQNTFTGRLTEPMFDAIWERARSILAVGQDSRRTTG